MTENKKLINIRVTAAEKRKLESMAAYCGLSLSEYLRKLGLGWVPRPALGDDFYQCYYRLCDLCNRDLSEDAEAALLYLIDDIREELMLPGKRSPKELKGGPAKPALWGEEDPRSAEPLGACTKSEGQRVI